MKLPIYLDYMATTPVDPRVATKMAACLQLDGNFGNPASRTHIYGWQAEEAVEQARCEVAALINAQPREIVWTSGATEAINLALKGVAYFYQRKGKHIITYTTEHKAVLDTCQALASEGYEITYLSPESNGLIDLAKLQAAIRQDTLLISLLQVNNEIGVVQDIAAVSALARQHGVLLHVDAAQSAGKIPLDVQALSVDLLSLSAHKVYGPKGIGALYVRRQPRVHLQPLIHGGGQERGLRAGTLPTHQIVGMGEAFRLAKLEMATEIPRIAQLRDRLWHSIAALGDVYLNGDMQQRVANNLNVSFAFVEGESLLLAMNNLAVSSGSACTSASVEPSHVLRALGRSHELAHSTVRFSLGRFTTEQDIDMAIEQVTTAVKRLRAMSPLWRS
ncbi:MAG: IscS subfamily cysteine desulfurase [Coxiellaceae bacterium]|nr:MAG: IscS subfamily cysteine desulfurase [Coxiellaceae bacterium]